MKTYPIPMIPGPVRVPAVVLEQYLTDYGSADLEPEYLTLYNQTEANLQKVFGTQNKVTIHSGEGMLALWGALKSCLVPGDRVLTIASGVFGYGIGDMAKSIGAEVKVIGLPYDQTIHDLTAIEQAIIEFRPKMVTAVHCETPSGTLNPIVGIGELKKKYGVPLLCVDAVASAGGTPVLTDVWQIDLTLGGSQKCLSMPPSLSFVAVSEKAWEIIDRVNYVGYDALKPFREAQEKFGFPYTPDWHSLAALHTSTEMLLAEGLENSFKRHQEIAEITRKRLIEVGYQLFPAPDAIPSPTVTAVKVPEGISWTDLDRRFRAYGLAVGGSYGPLTGKVFRLGHMGSQADRDLILLALEAVEKVYREIKYSSK